MTQERIIYMSTLDITLLLKEISRRANNKPGFKHQKRIATFNTESDLQIMQTGICKTLIRHAMRCDEL